MNLLWFDLETTGLNPEVDKVLEIGMILADDKLRIQFQRNWVIKYPYDLRISNGYVYNMHKSSGLLDECENGIPLHIAETSLIEICKDNFKNKISLAGNNIGFDRGFVKKHLPNFEQLLHHRMLDVSALKLVFEEQFKQKKFEKRDAHRSLNDIKESIEEYKHYCSVIEKGLSNV